MRNINILKMSAKISFSNYPILKKIKEKKLGKMMIREDDKIFFDLYTPLFKSLFENSAHYFGENIFVVSPHFMDALDKAKTKLWDLYEDILKNDIIDLIMNFSVIVGNVVLLFHHDIRKGSSDEEIVLFTFDKQGTPFAFHYAKNDIIDGVTDCKWVSNTIIYPPDQTKASETILYWFMACVLIYLFKKYAEVETKYLPANTKKYYKKEKYINDTSFNITHLDSKWFTTLIQSNAFKVRGHFRLQPIGPGRDDRKLIWINEFTKNGYTAKARILSEINN